MSTHTAVSRAYNFSAGPAVLPLSVLEQIKEEMLALPGVGSSILEISHRSQAFVEILDDARQRLVDLLEVPDTHEVLFLQGGARLQNAMIPMNLLSDPSQTADYIVTGKWGLTSSEEVRRYGKLNLAWNGADSGYSVLPQLSEIDFSDDAAYIHFTSNETIHGLQFSQPPANGDVPLVSDSSSDFLCRPCDVSKFGLIYACAQKNAGAAGVTVVIIRKDLLARSGDRLASYLDYAQQVKGGSMLNTPPTFAIYVSGLIFKWLQDQGGLESIYELNLAKSEMLYSIIDAHSGFYLGHVKNKADRSIMNVVFKLPSPELDKTFVEHASNENMTSLKGHRSLGGIRASIYNAMPVEGVQVLAEFMRDFVKKHG